MLQESTLRPNSDPEKIKRVKYLQANRALSLLKLSLQICERVKDLQMKGKMNLRNLVE